VQDAIHSSHLPEGVQVKTLQLENLPPVFAGEQSLRLVFTNLFENASAAMQGQGTITISGSAQCNQVEILVSDTGPGISQENQGKIFELNDSGNLSSHLGFGLWWVKTLMARLGGSVSVESDGQNGATFRLLLPSA
jgi:signal transduction histidine kinase